MPLLDYDDFYPWGKSFTPFYPTYEEFTPPYFAIRQIDKLAPCLCAESSIEWFQRNAPSDLTISYKSAKIYLHKGTADRRLVRI